jgi:hypothetical protein
MSKPEAREPASQLLQKFSTRISMSYHKFADPVINDSKVDDELLPGNASVDERAVRKICEAGTENAAERLRRMQ